MKPKRLRLRAIDDKTESQLAPGAARADDPPGVEGRTELLKKRTVELERELAERERAEAALKESEMRARAMYEAIPDMMFRLNREGVFLDYKAARSELHAQSVPTIIGRRNRDLTPPDFADLVEQQIRRTLETGMMQAFEYRLPIPGRGMRHYETRMVPSGTDEVTAIVRDVTERKEAEEARRRTWERREREWEVLARITTSPNLAEGAVEELACELTEAVATALEVERAGVWLFEADGNRLVNLDNYLASARTHSSGAVLLQKEYQNEFDALRAARFVDVPDALSDPRTAGYVEGYFKPNRIMSLLDAVIRLDRQNLGVLCLEAVERPRRWHHDEISLACQLADQVALAISRRERKQVEAALRESREKYRVLVEGTNDIVYSLSPGGVITYVSPQIARYGWSAEDVVSRPLDEMVHEEDRESVATQFADALSRRQTFVSEFRCRQRSGEVVWFSDNGRLQEDDKGNVMGLTGVLVDITERKRTEAKLHQQLDELRRWHDVMLGREQRVMELKREVNALCKRLGEPLCYANQAVTESGQEPQAPGS